MIDVSIRRNDPDASARARLIAAAPELLAALEHCLLEHGGYTIRGETERIARAAIAKAGGSTPAADTHDFRDYPAPERPDHDLDTRGNPLKPGT